MGPLSVVDAIGDVTARLEVGESFGGDGCRCSASRVAAFVGVVMPYREATKAPDLNALFFHESARQGVENEIDESLGVTSTDSAFRGHDLDEV